MNDQSLYRFALPVGIRSRAVAIALIAASSALLPASAVNLALDATVKASSEMKDGAAAKAIDGVESDASRWLAAPTDKVPWIEITLKQRSDLTAVDVYSGWKEESVLADFNVEVQSSGQWKSPEGGKVRQNSDPVRRVPISATGVEKVRVSLPSGGPGRIREIALYRSRDEAIRSGVKSTMASARIDRKSNLIALNQVGFQTAWPKRFTAPLTPDGTPFSVRSAKGGEPLFQGTITGNIGDFSAFRPAESDQEYVVEIKGGGLRDGVSDPFWVRNNLMKGRFWQPAVDFLIDARSVVGTHASAFGGCPWRDGTYYDAIIPALVLMQLSDPARTAAMPRQIDWEADKRRVLAPEFKYWAGDPGGKGVLEIARKYYQEIEPPRADAPDVVKLIHWGAGFYLVNPATQDPMGDPAGRRVHAQTMEQVAYVVWAWPVLKQWLPESFYNRCKALCFANWGPALEVDPLSDPSKYLPETSLESGNIMGGDLNPYKGRHAPGHSIVPNLLMYEVAKRDNRQDASKYLDAAVAQAAWVIKTIDWNDPRSTKGQRMSEHRTIPNLVWLLKNYPDKAPAGLKEKISAWADVAIRRSDNLWDYRRYDEDRNWALPKLSDIGNLVSFPACALSAAWVIDDPKVKLRLEEIAVAQADAAFGRNPRLAASPHKPEMGFTGIEYGWPRGHQENICARLELCRGSISSGPGTEMYPFNPDGAYRHAEGWVCYGAAWGISLSYMSAYPSGNLPKP
ncbi:discoidin domain-containing protein [Luteolibacter sp. LG18]|uniref:discoidin domain-containing protein n=1 Tax=Luteolibacter sp. LG18 TaxID=2819286 RepID=UPI002B296880|nr:hypothetical protein llg_32300 [Luteolibacter sp. LG18]